MRGIRKETSRMPRNRNQNLYVRSIGPGCWGTCHTVTQGGEWLSHKIPGAALWTSFAHTAWRRCPRWIVSPQPCLGDKNGVIVGREVWTVRRMNALDDWCMLLLAFNHVTYTRNPLAAGSDLPRSCRNHCLLQNATILSPVFTFQTPARFFFNASSSFLF